MDLDISTGRFDPDGRDGCRAVPIRSLAWPRAPCPLRYLMRLMGRVRLALDIGVVTGTRGVSRNGCDRFRVCATHELPETSALLRREFQRRGRGHVCLQSQ